MELSRRRMLTLGCAATASSFALAGCSNNKGSGKNNGKGKVNNKDLLVPKNTFDLDGFLVTTAGAVPAKEIPESAKNATNIHVIMDLHCPFCARFHEEAGDYLNDLIADEKYNVIFTVCSFLDEHSTDDYSSRAANALIEVGENSPESFWFFTNFLLENQPGEGDAYRSVSDRDLMSFATNFGVLQEEADMFEKHRYIPWVKSMTSDLTQRDDLFKQDGKPEEGFYTPTVFIGGEKDKDGKYSNFVRATTNAGTYVQDVTKAVDEYNSKNAPASDGSQ